ncbi:DUF2946 family protein [Methylophilus rhizosphaerae]|nr:DUF2946 family protein [Methylophilus rhizosphaerae]
MRKRLCLFLICWLPCFVMAANVMSLQMALAEQAWSSVAQPHQAEMPCHHMAGDQQEKQQAADHHAPASHHCTVCGFCMASTGVAHLDTFPHVSIIAQTAAAPLFEAAPVHSQTYPPAIKPPIFS